MSLPPPSIPETPDKQSRHDQQLRDLRFLETLQETLAGCRDIAALSGSMVHRVAAAFSAEGVCLASYEPITDTLDLLHQTGSRPYWDRDLLRQAIENGRTLTVGGTLAVPVPYALGPGEAHRQQKDRRRPWGVLAISRQAGPGMPTPYTSNERQVLRAAADRLAAELERRRVYLLDDVLDSLLRKTKPIDVYTHTLRELRRFLHYDHSASIMTMQRGMAQLTVRVEKLVSVRGAKETLVDTPRRGRTLRLTAAQMRFLTQLEDPIEVRHRETGYVVVQDGKELPSQGGNAGTAGLWRVLCLNGRTGRAASSPGGTTASPPGGEGSILCFPLVFGGQMLGILRLAARRPGAFEPLDQHLQLLDRFVRLLAVTLYRSELYHQSDRQLQAIKQIGRAITEPMTVEDVCRQVLQLALRVLHVQVGAVGLLGKDGALELVAHQGCTLAEVPILSVKDGIAGTVIKTGRSRAVPDVKSESGYVLFNGRVCSELVAPITYDREVIGFLDVESFEEGRFREEDEEVITFVEALANQAAIAIKTAQLHEDAMKRLGSTMAIDRSLSMAGLQDLLIEELRDKLGQLAEANDYLAAANRAKSEFLAHMSHDLRGPLNVIVGLSNLLLDPSVSTVMDPAKQRENLEMIHTNGQRLGALIGNILDLSAVEAGKAQLAVTSFEAQPTFNYLRSVSRTLAEESLRDVEITVAVDPAITYITADEDKFLRIMQNLIFNAVKFTPSGSISITATAETGDASSGAPESVLHVAVADTGIGIPVEDQERIFQPFQQVESTVARQYHGTGLGLTVVRQLVELHGGHVWLESTPGEGSVFHVLLPDALQEPIGLVRETGGMIGPGLAGAETIHPDPATVSIARPTALSILVVEDIPAHRNMMRLAVTSRGHTMHGVGSGAEALDWLSRNRPDVILLDMQLPDTDGFSIAAHLKSGVETHAIPIIAVTADALSVNEQRALNSGCDAYLTKPIDIPTLMSAIEAVRA